MIDKVIDWLGVGILLFRKYTDFINTLDCGKQVNL